MTMRILTQDELKSQLNYDPETGIFTRKIRSAQSVRIGDVAGWVTDDGYIQISLKNKKYLAHRLAWLYMTGEMPKEFIDHINGKKSDNRFCNLREATNAQNMRNTGLRSSNTSGFIGVSWDKAKKKWSSYGKYNYKKINLGYFDSAELASQAYQEFAKKHHGEFYFAN